MARLTKKEFCKLKREGIIKKGASWKDWQAVFTGKPSWMPKKGRRPRKKR